MEVEGPRLVLTYDGGVLVLDAASLVQVGDFELPGYLRVNPAGDEQHVLISTADGFQVLDTGVEPDVHGDHTHYFAQAPRLTTTLYPADHPGHAVVHGDSIALFSDGTGEAQVVDIEQIATGAVGSTYTAAAPHHGVAIPLDGGELLVSVGTEDARTGAQVVSADGIPSASTESCPGLHGEAAAADDVLVLGCSDGVVVFDGSQFTKVASPDSYGRIGNLAGSVESPVVLGDYKVDKDADLERPTRISLINTTTQELQLVDLGASYSFRSLARGPQGEALVLTTDGMLQVIDPQTGMRLQSIEVVAPWEESTDWHEPRPAIEVRGSTAYVTEPATQQIHLVSLTSGEVRKSISLTKTPDEIAIA